MHLNFPTFSLWVISSILLLFFDKGLANPTDILQVDSETNSIIDSQKRQRIFHGVNVVVKTFPYFPDAQEYDGCTSFVEQDLINLRDLGQNVIRLGVMWTGVYPQDGVVNNTYLNTMENIINRAGEYGIYTLIDMHQDLFSEKFCADGVPIWLLKEEDYEDFAQPLQDQMTYNSKGLPTNCSLPWGDYYFTKSVSRSFQKLYKNKDGWRDKWVQYWQTVAQQFKGNPYVLGYELINEPWAGDVFKNPLLLIPGKAESWNFQKAYDILNNKIREIDDEHLIFFEPVTWLNQFPTGFKHAPGGSQYANKSVFSYHYYFPPDLSAKSTIEARVKDIKKLGTAGMLSEFFIADPINGVGTFPEDSLKVLEECDNNFQGWMGWIYKPFSQCSSDSLSTGGIYYGNGTYVPSIAQNITRTYAQAIAGKGIKMSYETKTADFQLQYEICIECGETIIYANTQYHYNEGIEIYVYPTNSLQYEQNPYHLISFTGNPNSNIKNGDLVEIRLQRKGSNSSFGFDDNKKYQKIDINL